MKSIPSYAFRTYLFKIGIINYSDFPKIHEDVTNPRSQIISLTHVLENFQELDFSGKSSSDMAHRIYKSWTNHQKENSVRSLFLIKLVHQARVKSSFFTTWALSKAKTRSLISQHFGPPKPDLFKSEKVQKGRLSHNSSYNSLNYDPNTLTPGQENVSTSLKPRYFRSEDKELEECTFRPEISAYSQQKTSIYSKFSPQGLKEKEELYKHQKVQKELEGCTFQPRTNYGKNLSLDRSFEKLYKDAEVHRQKMRNKEMIEKDKEIAECTFKPNVLNPSKSVTGNVYEKLYKNYQDSQREKRRVQMEKEVKEIQENSFAPKLLTPKKNSDDVPVYIRLYSEMEKKKEKMKKNEEEKPRPSSVNHSRNPEDPPRYEALYALHKETSSKRLALQEKVFKESGAVFKPNTSKPGTPKRSSPLKSK